MATISHEGLPLTPPSGGRKPPIDEDGLYGRARSDVQGLYGPPIELGDGTSLAGRLTQKFNAAMGQSLAARHAYPRAEDTVLLPNHKVAGVEGVAAARAILNREPPEVASVAIAKTYLSDMRRTIAEARSKLGPEEPETVDPHKLAQKLGTPVVCMVDVHGKPTLFKS